ncbi:hypothetical protein H0H93_008689 [Arthromyces matolae]|nr:hypothetical protein H0H93_008689 [Arthromyces matolae]
MHIFEGVGMIREGRRHCYQKFHENGERNRNQLPRQLLDSIFQRSYAPRFLLDPTPERGTRTPWLHSIRTKLVLSNVCRLWNEIATPLLYEDIALRRWEPMESFMRTIDDKPEYGKFVRIIEIHVLLTEEGDYRQSLIDEYLDTIIIKCPLLADLRIPTKYPLTLGTRHSPDLWPPITHLSLNLYPGPDLLHLLRLSCKTLVHLSIAVGMIKKAPPSTYPPIHLPRLKYLAISGRFYGQHSELRAQAFIESLNVQSLHTLAINTVQQEMIDVLTSFLESNGQNIRSLFCEWYDRADIRGFLDKCPGLEHLALNHGKLSYPISHSNVKWLDVELWYNEEPWKWADAQAAFPSLQGLRELHTTGNLFLPIVTSVRPDIVVSDKDKFVLGFPAIRLTHRRGCVEIQNFRNKIKEW